MEICKAPTLLLKALNKHTHIMYIEMKNVIKKKKKKDIDNMNNNNIASAERNTCTETVGAASRFFSRYCPHFRTGRSSLLICTHCTVDTYCTVARDIRHPLVIVAAR